jgi:hypothetical protein
MALQEYGDDDYAGNSKVHLNFFWLIYKAL